MTTRPADPITPAQRKALMYAEEDGTLDCLTRVGNSLVRKGYARETLGFEITAAGRRRVATGRCERCNAVGTLMENPFEADLYGTRVMTYLCEKDAAELANEI